MMMLHTLERGWIGRARQMFLCAAACLVVMMLPVTVAAQSGPQTPPAVEKVDARKRIIVIGASASDGFGLDVRVSDALSARLDQERFVVENRASSYFFLWAEKEGKLQVDAVQSLKPAAVVGVDFLFWFAYGTRPEADREAMLEKGLKLAEGIEAPFIMAELPDMREAIGRMLLKSQVPAPETLKKLNARIAEWAKGRKNVVLVPLGTVLDRMRKGEDLQMEGLPYDVKSLPPMLQRDKLHPTLDGVFVLSELSLIGLRTLPGVLQPQEITVEPAVALQALKATALAKAKQSATAEPVPGGK